MTNVPGPRSVIPTEEIRDLLRPHPRALAIHDEVAHYFGSSLRFERAVEADRMSITQIQLSDALEFGGVSIRLKNRPNLAASLTHELFHARYFAQAGAVPLPDGQRIKIYAQLANAALHETFVRDFQDIFPLSDFMQESQSLDLNWYRNDIKDRLNTGQTKDFLKPEWYQVYFTLRVSDRHGLVGRSGIADEMIAWPESPWPELKQDAKRFESWINRGVAHNWRDSKATKDHFTILTDLCGLPPFRFYRLERTLGRIRVVAQ